MINDSNLKVSQNRRVSMTLSPFHQQQQQQRKQEKDKKYDHNKLLKALKANEAKERNEKKLILLQTNLIRRKEKRTSVRSFVLM